MHRITKRILAVVLCAAAILSCLPQLTPSAGAAMPEHENTYVNTGDQRKDIIGVALTQLGYQEAGKNNDTKYGTWYGLPYNPWCAMFVTWCARQADIPTDVLKRSAKADPRSGYFGIKTFYSNQKTPSPGDLFFTTGNTHVGLVYYVEGDYFYTIEGNSNANHSTEGYCVISNKRKLSGFKFASPAYKGGDKAHEFVFKQENAHPHRTYYQCSKCNAMHYTGNTVCVSGCKQCFSCGCSEASAGYYLCQIPDGVASVRPGHTNNVTDKTRLGYIGDGMVVYVHGMAGSYACIEYDNLRGHVLSKYLKAYYPAPQAPEISTEKYIYRVDSDVIVNWSKPANTEEFLLRIYKDEKMITETKTTETRFVIKKAQIGEYTAQIVAGNRTGCSQPSEVFFSVRGTYQLTYDCKGGTGGPNPQIQTKGEPTTISDTVPVRKGFDFLGWTADPSGRFVEYVKKDTLSSSQDVKLYAVWKESTAAVSQLSIHQMPIRRYFLLNEELDTEGLILKVLYSDGSGHNIRSGFTTSGFSSQKLADLTVTVTYQEQSATYPVHIVPYIPGDINEDKKVNRDDVIKLLWHINFPGEHPIAVPADYTSDNKVNRDDVIKILWHVNFPYEYSLDLPSGS